MIPLRGILRLITASGLLTVCHAAASDSVVVLNEFHYHPSDTGESLEFVELQNQMSIQIDISGWSVEGLGNFTVPEATTIPAGGYVVIARDPAALAAATGHNGALGPYTGRLDNAGESLTLRNHSGRAMDVVDYRDEAPWPVAADGSGASLSRIRSNAPGDRAASWGASRFPNGTPGAANAVGAPPPYAHLEFSEISGAGTDPFVVELRNTSPLMAIPLADLILSNGAASHLISNGQLAAGEHLSISLEFTPATGKPLFLIASDDGAIIDAVRVDATALARQADKPGGAFLNPDFPTPDAPNTITLEDQVVINEILYQHSPNQPSRSTVFGMNSDWKYEQSGTDLGEGWQEPAFQDSAWPSGPGILGFETDAALKALIGTTLQRFVGGVPPNQPITYYFRKSFIWSGPLTPLSLDLLLDDGAVIYLNGSEIHRVGMPAGAIDYNTQATTAIGDAVPTRLALPAALLANGVNVLAVEVHQQGTASSDLIFGMATTADSPWSENDQEWIELHNHSAIDAVDLSHWSLHGPVAFSFPSGASIPPGGYLVLARHSASFEAEYPSVPLAGSYSGRLGNASGHLVLRDARGNPADEVRYYDAKPWPTAADGGGSSLELRDPRADNAIPESWGASNEADRSGWSTYSLRGTATNRLPGAPTNFQEFQFGLLDSGGECLLDDISVVEAPDGTAIERLANGSFSAGASGWRFRGNHQRSSVGPEPGNPGNQVLHLRASGNTEYMGNQIETTFASGASIIEGATYSVSFRAKWLTGSPLLNSRLYFDRLAAVTILETPLAPGTPGAANSTLVANAGPTFSGLRHSPVVPSAGQGVTVSVTATDPDGIASLELRFSVNGGAFATVPMAATGGGNHAAGIPGQNASSLVQFYLRALDGAGAIADYPAAGPASRAMYKVNDGTSSNVRQNLRIVMTTADSDHLHNATNVLSNERLPATIVYNESEAFYDVEGVRLKGSYVGRNVPRVGFNIAFNADHPFRGVHSKVAIDRSAGGSIADVSEMFLFHVYTQAGGILPSRYDDIIQCLAPRSAQTSVGHLRLAGFDGEYLDSVYENGADGDMFEFETLRWTTATHDGTPTGLKLPGNGFAAVPVGNSLGGDKESYRASYFLMNNRSRDDYMRLITFNETMALNGLPFSNSIGDIIDLEQWARVFAVQSLMGHLDIYNRGIEHNFRFYVRPSDRRVLAFPWDWDFIFQSSSQNLGGDSPSFAKLLGLGAFRRSYYGHIRDIMGKTFNRGYMDPWVDHYASVSGNNFSTVKSFISSRTTSVQNQLNAAAPPLAFSISTNGGADFQVSSSFAVLEGKGWIDIRDILVNGLSLTAPPQWIDFDTWRMNIPLAPGANALTLTALDFDGLTAGTDSITVTNTTPVTPASASNIAISEVMYHPADPHGNAEFVELLNYSSGTVDLSGVAFTEGIQFTFSPGTSLATGERLLVVRDAAAFAAVYGSGIIPEGSYVDALANSGERLLLLAANSSIIAEVPYGDSPPWPTGADGGGPSLVLRNPGTNPALPGNWREGTSSGGNPGSTDSVRFAGDPEADADSDGLSAFLEYAFGTSDLISNPAPLAIELAPGVVVIAFRVSLAADDATVFPEHSGEPLSWERDPVRLSLLSSESHGDGTVTLTYQWTAPTDPGFLRVRATTVP